MYLFAELLVYGGTNCIKFLELWAGDALAGLEKLMVWLLVSKSYISLKYFHDLGPPCSHCLENGLNKLFNICWVGKLCFNSAISAKSVIFYSKICFICHPIFQQYQICFYSLLPCKIVVSDIAIDYFKDIFGD